MAHKEPDLDLPDVDEKEGFPWILLIIIVVAIGAAAAWLMYGKSYHGGQDTVAVALEQQLAADKKTLDQEKDKVFEMTNQLDALKQSIKLGQAKDKKAAIEEYNKLAVIQNSQREKVKRLGDEYNAKVNKLRELQ